MQDSWRLAGYVRKRLKVLWRLFIFGDVYRLLVRVVQGIFIIYISLFMNCLFISREEASLCIFMISIFSTWVHTEDMLKSVRLYISLWDGLSNFSIFICSGLLSVIKVHVLVFISLKPMFSRLKNVKATYF